MGFFLDRMFSLCVIFWGISNGDDYKAPCDTIIPMVNAISVFFPFTGDGVNQTCSIFMAKDKEKMLDHLAIYKPMALLEFIFCFIVVGALMGLLLNTILSYILNLI